MPHMPRPEVLCRCPPTGRNSSASRWVCWGLADIGLADLIYSKHLKTSQNSGPNKLGWNMMKPKQELHEDLENKTASSYIHSPNAPCWLESHMAYRCIWLRMAHSIRVTSKPPHLMCFAKLGDAHRHSTNFPVHHTSGLLDRLSSSGVVKNMQLVSKWQITKRIQTGSSFAQQGQD